MGNRRASIVRISEPTQNPKSGNDNVSKNRKKSIDSQTETKIKNRTTSATIAPTCPAVHPPLIHRANLLHSEYIRLLLESLVRLASAYRCLSYRGLTPKQRALLGSTLNINPINLPGEHISTLFGTYRGMWCL